MKSSTHKQVLPKSQSGHVSLLLFSVGGERSVKRWDEMKVGVYLKNGTVERIEPLDVSGGTASTEMN